MDVAGLDAVVVWPREGEPVVIYDTIAAGPSVRDSCVTQHHEFDGFNNDCFQALATVLSDMGLANSSVGFESNIIGFRDWTELARRLPKLEMKDCTSTLDQTRWIKTQAGGELIRAGALLLDECYLEVLAQTRAGDTERRARPHDCRVYSTRRRMGA
jgi:Xaa-Pro aminopeptidase